MHGESCRVPPPPVTVGGAGPFDVCNHQRNAWAGHHRRRGREGAKMLTSGASTPERHDMCREIKLYTWSPCLPTTLE